MHSSKFLQCAVILVLILSVSACGASSAPATTATPAQDVGKPVANSNWEVTVKGAHEAARLMTASTPGSFTPNYYTPKDPYTFLVVDVVFHNLDSAQETEFTGDAIAVVSNAGEISTVAGHSNPYSGTSTTYSLGGTTTFIFKELKEQPLSLVFTVKKDAISKSLKFQFKDLPRIPFSVEPQNAASVSTPVASSPGTSMAESTALPSPTPIRVTLTSTSSTISVPYCKDAKAKGIISGNTYLCLSSEQGERIGGGKNWLLTPADNDFTIHAYGQSLELHIGPQQGGWPLRLGPPMGQSWKTGLYENADMSSGPSNSALLDISGNSVGCDAGTSKGRFELIELNYVLGNLGGVEQLAANFEYHCDGRTPALWGVLRFNSTVAP